MNDQDKPDTHPDRIIRLDLEVNNNLLPRFFLLLQQGVMLRTHIACSIEVFLSEEIGAGRDTIDKIQSIFLDGCPVDDIRAATIRNGSVLALSAALPGLVGATMRRGGAYASFRSTITYHETTPLCGSGEGFVQIKLFNLLMKELGPGLLKRGIIVQSSALTTLLKEQQSDFWQGCGRSLLDGSIIGAQTLKENKELFPGSSILLVVTTSGIGL